MNDLIKSPEKKIKSSVKLLDSISSKLDKSATELTTKLSTVRNLETVNDNLSFSLLDLERKSKQEAVTAATEQAQAQVRSLTSPGVAGAESDTFAKSSFAMAAAAAMAANVQPTSPDNVPGGEDIIPMTSDGGYAPTGTDVTDIYGYRPNRRREHYGIDLSSSKFSPGAPISVIYSGQVVSVEYESGGYGNYVIIKHSNNLYSVYAHLQKVNVKVNDMIAQNGESTVIGTIGSTGSSTGPHLHFELGRRWNPHKVYDTFNPLPYAKNFIRVGGRVKTRPQNQPTSSVTPQTRPAASPTQVTPSPQSKPQPRAQQLNNTQAVAQTPQQTQPTNIIAQINNLPAALKLNQALNTR